MNESRTEADALDAAGNVRAAKVARALVRRAWRELQRLGGRRG